MVVVVARGIDGNWLKSTPQTAPCADSYPLVVSGLRWQKHRVAVKELKLRYFNGGTQLLYLLCKVQGVIGT